MNLDGFPLMLENKYLIGVTSQIVMIPKQAVTHQETKKKKKSYQEIENTYIPILNMKLNQSTIKWKLSNFLTI